MQYSEFNSENCRERLGAVLTLVRLYAQEIVNHTTVILLTCELDKDNSEQERQSHDNVDEISKAAKKIGAVAYKMSSLEAEYRDYAM